MDNLSELSSQLPLLDKAKLFSLTAYSIESLLFASLKLEGQDAQNHEVFTELKRIQQYFAKIKAAEEPEPEAQRSTTVNKEAAARILKSDLADNKTISSKLAEKIAEERAKALLKSMEQKKRPIDDSQAAPEAEGDAKQSKKPKKGDKKHNGKNKKNRSSTK